MIPGSKCLKLKLKPLTLNILPATCETAHFHCPLWPLQRFTLGSVGLFSSWQTLATHFVQQLGLLHGVGRFWTATKRLDSDHIHWYSRTLLVLINTCSPESPNDILLTGLWLPVNSTMLYHFVAKQTNKPEKIRNCSQTLKVGSHSS